MRQPSWNEIIEKAIASDRYTLHTAMPGTIKAYSEGTQTAKVELASRLQQPGGSYEAVPPLPDVPVVWPGAWADGDSCLIVFAEDDFSGWFESGNVSTPEIDDRHGYHALCIPIVARAGDAVEFVALANLVLAELTTLKDAISNAVPVAQDGGAALQTSIVAALSAWPGSVAAAKVKAR